MLITLIIILVGAQPPELHEVEGYVFINEEGLQAPTGVKLLVNSSSTQQMFSTETYGPPGETGYYALSVNGSDGDEIIVTSYNATFYGRINSSLAPNPGITKVNLTLNITRDAEANVTITSPSNSTKFYLGSTFNTNAAVMILGWDGIGCNATISFSNESVLNLSTGENYTNKLGNVNRESYANTIWTLYPIGEGRSNITVNATCENSGVNIEGLDSFTVYEIIIKSGMPDLHSVEGYVFESDGITQMPSGIPVVIAALETGSNVNTETYGPPGHTGYYSTAELNATDGEEISVRAETSFNYGISYAILSDSPSITEVNVTINMSKNVAPNVTSVLIEDDTPFPEDEIDLVSNYTQPVFCTAMTADENGFTDIFNATATFYDSSVATLSSPEDNNSYYYNNSCSLTGCLEDRCDVHCTFDVWYYANNNSDSSWICNITSTDSNNSKDSNTDNTNMNVLISLDLPDKINYGIVVPDNVSDEITINVTNLGNTQLDLNISGYGTTELDGLAMSCSDGNTISVEHEKYNLTESNPQVLNFNQVNSMHFNLSTEGDVREFDMPHRQDDTSPDTDGFNATYWRLYMPKGLSSHASCTGFVVVTGILG